MPATVFVAVSIVISDVGADVFQTQTRSPASAIGLGPGPTGMRAMIRPERASIRRTSPGPSRGTVTQTSGPRAADAERAAGDRDEAADPAGRQVDVDDRGVSPGAVGDPCVRARDRDVAVVAALRQRDAPLHPTGRAIDLHERPAQGDPGRPAREGDAGGRTADMDRLLPQPERRELEGGDDAQGSSARRVARPRAERDLRGHGGVVGAEAERTPRAEALDRLARRDVPRQTRRPQRVVPQQLTGRINGTGIAESEMNALSGGSGRRGCGASAAAAPSGYEATTTSADCGSSRADQPGDT